MSTPGPHGKPPRLRKRDRILGYVQHFVPKRDRFVTSSPSISRTSIQDILSKSTPIVLSHDDPAPEISGALRTTREPTAQETPTEKTPAEELPAQETPVHDPAVQESPRQELSLHEPPTQKTSGQHFTSCTAPVSPSSTCYPEASISLWKQALDKLKPGDRDPITEMQSNQQELQNVDDLIEKLDKKRQEWLDQQWTMQTGKGPVPYREYAERVIGFLYKFKEVGDTLVQYDPVHAAIPWAGARFFIQLLVSESEQIQFLLHVSDKITLITGACRVYESLYTRDTIKESVFLEGLHASLINLYVQVLETTAKSHKLLSQPTARRVLSAIVPTWKEDEKKLEELYHSVMQATGLCDKRLINQTSQMQNNITTKVNRCQEFLRTIDSSLRELHSSLSEVDSKVNAVLEKVEDVERTRILDWTSSVTFGSDHQSVREHWTPGTCEWLPQDDRFRTWKSSPDSVLLVLFGSPGTGKTYLTSQVIDHIIREGVGQDEAFGYFYCDRNDPKRNHPTAILQTWLRQLAAPERAKDKVHPALRKAWKDGTDNGIGYLQLSSCEDMMARLTQDFTRTTLVLDALDECDKDSRHRILKTLVKIPKTCSTRPVRVFISSRPDVDITTAFQAWPRIEIQATNNANDISKFFAAEVARLGSWEDIKEDTRDEIMRVLQAKSNGMFQWAKLQIEQLLHLGTEEDILARLGKLPKDLKTTYDELYTQFGEEGTRQRLLANRAIQWVLSSPQPLEEKALLWAISQDPDSNSISDIRVTTKNVLTFTRNLLVLATTQRQSPKVWRLSHLSVAEYFEDNHANLFCSTATHTQAATVSLRTLLSKPRLGRDNQVLVGRDIWDSIHLNILQYWPDHVSQAGTDGGPRLISLLKRFLGSLNSGSDDYRNWVQDMSVTRDWDSYEWEPTMPMFGICENGIYQLLHDWWEDLVLDKTLLHVEHHGERLAQVAIRRNHHQLWRRLIPEGLEFYTPEEKSRLGADLLSTAAANDSLQALEFLLDSGFDCNAETSEVRSVFATAAAKGTVQALELLLRHGAEVNKVLEHGDYGSALVAACYGANIEIVQFLLDKGAEVNMVLEHGDYGSALVAACIWGGTEMVRLLVERGAEVDMVLEHNDYGSALVAACGFHGREGIVRLLLEEGADVNRVLEHGYYGNALVSACVGGETEIVRLLLEKGAGVNKVLKHGGFGSALVAACTGEETEIVQLLLEKGADVHQVLKHENFGGALVAACAKGGADVVRFLLGKGAEVNQVLEHGRFGSALVAACYEGKTEIVRLLLEKAADVHQVLEHGNYGNALVAACASERATTEIVQLLLENAVQVNKVLEHGRFGSALVAACYEGKTEIARLLLEKGADVHQVLERGVMGSVLVAACFRQKMEILQLLLDQGAEVNQALDYGYFGSALVAACAGGGTEMVRLLLEQGAEVNQVLKQGIAGSALVAACAVGETAMVRLLLEQGADFNQVLEHGDLGSAFVAACVGGEMEIVEVLLGKGVNIHDVLQHGKYGNALVAACYSGRTEIVRFLMDKGVDVHQVLEHGNYGSALVAACASEWATAEIVRLLLDKGADVNIVLDGQHKTALSAALSWPWQKCHAQVEILLEAEADRSLLSEEEGKRLVEGLVAQRQTPTGADRSLPPEEEGM